MVGHTSKMKFIVLFSMIRFINCLSLDLKFNSKTQIKMYSEFNASFIFITCVVLKNETEKFTDEKIHYDESCVRLNDQSSNYKTNKISLESHCSDIYCNKYMINRDYGSLMMQKYCPLSGTIKEANLFIKKNHKILYNFNDMYIFVDGCYFVNENGTKTEVLWVISDHYSIAESIASKVYDNDFLFRRYRAEDVNFNNRNKDCSNLCKPILCSGEVFETPVEDSGFSTNDFIYVGLIICVISFVGVSALCIKKRFM